MTNIKPLEDRVLIKPIKVEEKTESGLIIPEAAKEKPQRGEVVAVGPGIDGIEMQLKVGDTVLYGKYMGTEIDGFLIMEQSKILAIV